jgi:hypothetical protein
VSALWVLLSNSKIALSDLAAGGRLSREIEWDWSSNGGSDKSGGVLTHMMSAPTVAGLEAQGID